MATYSNFFFFSDSAIFFVHLLSVFYWHPANIHELWVICLGDELAERICFVHPLERGMETKKFPNS